MSISVIRLHHRSGFLHFFFCISMKIAAEPKQLGVPSTCVFRPPGRRLIYSVCFPHGWLRGEHASQINTSAAGCSIVSVCGLRGYDGTVWKDTVNAYNCRNAAQRQEDYM